MMRRNISIYALCAVWSSVLIAQRIDSGIVGLPGDPVRMAEVQQRVQMDLVKQQQREVKFRQELERRQFQGRFNELIKAINSFAKQYNDGNGMVWPQGEAAKLEKAMRSVEKSLGALPGMTNDRKGISR